MKPCLERHPAFVENCPSCHLAKYDAKYQRLWGISVDAPLMPCIYLGEATGETVRCPTCVGHVELKTFACTEHGICTLGKPAPGVKGCCNGCKEKRQKPFMQVKCISAGIGDAFMALTIAEGLKQQFPNTEMVVVANHVEWLRLFDGFLFQSEPLKGPLVYCEHDVGTKSFQEFRARKISRVDYWGAEFNTTPAIPSLKPLPTRTTEQAIRYSGRVVLAPFAAYAERTWKLERWLELEQLLIARGFRCVILSDTAFKTDQFVSDKFLGKTPVEVAALLSVAVCMVGNDSGMAHFAGMLQRPTVALCSLASDANIFGIYPTVTSLGKSLEGTKPGMVLQAVVAKIGENLGEFPASRFASIILDVDRWRLDCWQHVYATIFQTVKQLNPKKIVEIGTRAGYSAWAMLQACPGATVIGIDADLDEHGGFQGACEYAKKINPERFELRIENSQTLERLPAADLAYVDGDHSQPGCTSDMELVERSGIPKMLVDDTQFAEVRAAIVEFLAAHPEWSVRHIPSDTGLALLEKQ